MHLRVKFKFLGNGDKSPGFKRALEKDLVVAKENSSGITFFQKKIGFGFGSNIMSSLI
jgi:hypothetical protein